MCFSVSVCSHATSAVSGPRWDDQVAQDRRLTCFSYCCTNASLASEPSSLNCSAIFFLPELSLLLPPYLSLFFARALEEQGAQTAEVMRLREGDANVLCFAGKKERRLERNQGGETRSENTTKSFFQSPVKSGRKSRVYVNEQCVWVILVRGATPVSL